MCSAGREAFLQASSEALDRRLFWKLMTGDDQNCACQESQRACGETFDEEWVTAQPRYYGASVSA